MFSNLVIVFSRTLLAFILISVFSFQSFAQQVINKKADNFQIQIELYNDVVKLTCSHGCAWDELAFTLHDGTNVDINQYGVADRMGDHCDTELAEFRFNIKRHAETLSLESKKGTAWNKLTFICKPNECGQSLDQNGLIPTK